MVPLCVTALSCKLTMLFETKFIKYSITCLGLQDKAACSTLLFFSSLLGEIIILQN